MLPLNTNCYNFMALTFIWGGLWIGYWIVDIGGWYVSVWTMCILSVGWTCCQPKRWLSSRAAVLGLAAAAAWQQKYLMLAPGLHLGSGSSLEPRPQLTSASPSLNTLPAAWSPPPPPQLTSLPHQHTIISDITLTMESSHSSPLYSHTRDIPQGMQLMNSIPWGTQPSTYRDQINYICQKNKSFHYAWMCR